MASGKVGKKPKDNFCQRMDIIHKKTALKALSVVLFYSLFFHFRWNFPGISQQGVPFSGPGLPLSFAAPNIEQQPGPRTAKPATPMPKTWVELVDYHGYQYGNFFVKS